MPEREIKSVIEAIDKGGPHQKPRVSYEMGDQVRVTVYRVDVDRRELDFRLVHFDSSIKRCARSNLNQHWPSQFNGGRLADAA